MSRIGYTLTIVLFSLLAIAPAQSQNAAAGAVESIPGGIALKAGATSLRITAISPTAFRVRYSQTGKFAETNSFAVIDTPRDTPLQRHDNATAIILSTGQVSAAIDRQTGRVSFLDG